MQLISYIIMYKLQVFCFFFEGRFRVLSIFMDEFVRSWGELVQIVVLESSETDIQISALSKLKKSYQIFLTAVPQFSDWLFSCLRNLFSAMMHTECFTCSLHMPFFLSFHNGNQLLLTGKT